MGRLDLVGSRYQVQQGDCLASLAARFGFPSADALHQHPENEGLKSARPSPHHLAPGDVVVIPDREAKVEPVATGREHLFRAVMPKTRLKVFLEDGEGAALSDKRYRLEVGGETLEGRTDGSGWVDHEVSVGVTAGDLFVWLDATGDEPDLHLPVHIGHLDPLDTDTGWRARLRQLGYPCPERGDDVVDEKTRAALLALQRDHDLDPTGEPDDATCAKLRELHRES